MTQQDSIECIILGLIKAKQLLAAPVQEEIDRLANIRNCDTSAAAAAAAVDVSGEPWEPTTEVPARIEEENALIQPSQHQANELPAAIAQSDSELAPAPPIELNPFADMAAWLARQDSHNEPVSFKSKPSSPVPAPSAAMTANVIQQQQEEQEEANNGDDEMSEADSFFDAVHEQQQRQDAAEVDYSFGNFSDDENQDDELEVNQKNEAVTMNNDLFAEDNMFGVDGIDDAEVLFEDPFTNTENHIDLYSAESVIRSQEGQSLSPALDSPFDDNQQHAGTALTIKEQRATQIAVDNPTIVDKVLPAALSSLPISNNQSRPPARRRIISGPVAKSGATGGIASESHHSIAKSKLSANDQHVTMNADFEEAKEESKDKFLYLDKTQKNMQSVEQLEVKLDSERRSSSRRGSKSRESIATDPSQSVPVAHAISSTSDDNTFSHDNNGRVEVVNSSSVNQKLQFDEEHSEEEEQSEEIFDDEEKEEEVEEVTKPPPQQYFYEEYIPDFDPSSFTLSIEQQQQLLPDDLNEEVNYLSYLQDKIDRNRNYASSVLEVIPSPPFPAVLHSSASSRSNSSSPAVTRQQQKRKLSLVVGDHRRRTFHSSLVYGDHLPVNIDSDDESVIAKSQKTATKSPLVSAARALFATVDDEEHSSESNNINASIPSQRSPLHMPGSILDCDEPMVDDVKVRSTAVSWSNRNISCWQQLPLSSPTASFDHLRELDLSHNALTSIDFDCLPSNLIKLNLSSNNVTSMADLHVNCKKLKILVLANNQIKIIDTLPPALLYLDISGNFINTTVAMRALSLSNKQLQFVDVSANPIVKSSSASVAIRAFLPSLTSFHTNIKNSNNDKNKSSYSVVQMFAAEHWPRLRHCRATNDIITIACFEDMKVAIQQDILRAIELAQQPVPPANSSGISGEEQRKLDHERSNYQNSNSQVEEDKYKPYDPTQDAAFLHRTKIIPEDVQSLIKRLYHDPIEAEKRKLERQQRMRNNADYAESVRSSFGGTIRTGDHFSRTRASSFMSQRSSNATVNAGTWDDSMSVGASSVRSKSTVRTSVSSLSRSSTVVGSNSKMGRLQVALPRHRLNSHFDLLDHLTSSDNNSRSGRSQSVTSNRTKRNSSLLNEFKAAADISNSTMRMTKSTVDIEAWKEETSRKLGRCAILLHMLTDLAQTHSAEDGAAGGGGGLSHSTLRSMNEEWMELGFLSSDGQQFLSNMDAPDFLASNKQDSICEVMWNKLCDYRQLFSQLHDALSISIQQQLTFQPLLQGVMSGPVGKRVLVSSNY